MKEIKSSCQILPPWIVTAEFVCVELDQFRNFRRQVWKRLSGGKEEFLCANSVFLCVSVVKLLEKHITTETQRSHGEPQRWSSQTSRSGFINMKPSRAAALFRTRRWRD